MDWNKERIQGIVRHVLTAAGGIVAGSALAKYLTPDMIETIGGILAMLISGYLSAKAPEKAPAAVEAAKDAGKIA